MNSFLLAKICLVYEIIAKLISANLLFTERDESHSVKIQPIAIPSDKRTKQEKTKYTTFSTYFIFSGKDIPATPIPFGPNRFA